VETDIHDLRPDRPHHQGLELPELFVAAVATVPRRRVQRFVASVRLIFRGRVHGKSRVSTRAHGRPEAVERVRRHEL